MNQLYKTALLLFLIVLPCALYAQWTPPELEVSTALEERDANKLRFKIETSAFFKNNEYFSPVAEGQTLPGIHLTPHLSYQIDSVFRIQLGGYKIAYSGKDSLQNLNLLDGLFYRFQYTPNPNTSLILGNIYGGVNHKLIEPLYRWERQFSEKPESGIQFLYHNQRSFVDVWINWKRFIQQGDAFPEVLTFGTSASIGLTAPNAPIRFSVPLQLLVFHEGGQIDTSDKPMVVMGNMATGICSEWMLDETKLIKSISFSTYIAGYYDKLSNDALRPFTKGWGIYPVLKLNAAPFVLMMGYWSSNKFYAFEGEELFNSFNTYEPGKQLAKREIATLKFAYSKQIRKSVSIGGQIETYTDLKRQSTDYSFGVHLRFSM